MLRDTRLRRFGGGSGPTLRTRAREQALDRMVAEAQALGGNAVIAVRFSTSMVVTGAAELLATGTAVVLDDAPRP